MFVFIIYVLVIFYSHSVIEKAISKLIKNQNGPKLQPYCSHDKMDYKKSFKHVLYDYRKKLEPILKMNSSVQLTDLIITFASEH